VEHRTRIISSLLTRINASNTVNTGTVECWADYGRPM